MPAGKEVHFMAFRQDYASRNFRTRDGPSGGRAFKTRILEKFKGLSDYDLGRLVAEGKSASRRLEEIKSGGNGGAHLCPEYSDLAARKRVGEEARGQLIQNAVPLAIWFAKQNRVKAMGRVLGLMPDDLAGIGMEGAIIAVDRFDPGRSTNFKGCALGWIRECINRRLFELRDIRLPEYIYTRRIAYGKALSFIRGKPMDEITAGMPAFSAGNVSAGRIVGDYLRGKTTLRQIESKLREYECLSSAKSFLGNSDTVEAMDWRLDFSQGSEEETTGEISDRELLRKLVSNAPGLKKNHYRILESFYFGDAPLSHFAKKAGLTRERAGQLHDQLILILRKYALSKGIDKEYGPTVPGTEHTVSASRQASFQK